MSYEVNAIALRTFLNLLVKRRTCDENKENQAKRSID